MTTIVNTPPTDNSANNGMGMLFGVLVLIVLSGLFIVYGLPMIRNMTNGGVQINVPKDIDVNVNQTE